MKKVHIAARLAGVGPAVPDVMADYACDGPAMLGVIRIAAGSSDIWWLAGFRHSPPRRPSFAGCVELHSSLDDRLESLLVREGALPAA